MTMPSRQPDDSQPTEQPEEPDQQPQTEPAEPDEPATPVDLTLSSTWEGHREEQQKAQHVINAIPDQGVGLAFKTWVGENVEINRGDPHDPPIGVEPAGAGHPIRLNVYDSFWQSEQDKDRSPGANYDNPYDNDTKRTNVGTFELGKAVWHGINGPDQKIPQTDAAREFQNDVLDKHAAAIGEMKFAKWRGQDLGTVTDTPDLQSQFAYASRVAVLNLDRPGDASVSTAEWNAARSAMQDYLQKHLQSNH
jgi:hypothetical protein